MRKLKFEKLKKPCKCCVCGKDAVCIVKGLGRKKAPLCADCMPLKA